MTAGVQGRRAKRCRPQLAARSRCTAESWSQTRIYTQCTSSSSFGARACCPRRAVRPHLLGSSAVLELTSSSLCSCARRAHDTPYAAARPHALRTPHLDGSPRPRPLALAPRSTTSPDNPCSRSALWLGSAWMALTRSRHTARATPAASRRDAPAATSRDPRRPARGSSRSQRPPSRLERGRASSMRFSAAQ